MSSGIDDLKVRLDNLAGGVIEERFQHELTRVIDNIYDPNTSLAKRGIKLEVDFKPNKNRTQTDVTIKVTTKLAPTEPMETVVFISQTRAGLVASEYNPKQPFLNEELQQTITGGANVTPLRQNGGNN